MNLDATPTAAATTPGPATAGDVLPPRLLARLGGVQDQLAARARAATTRVVFARGEVVAFDAVTRLERPVETDDRLAGDVRVRLRGAATRALLALPDGSELWLDGESELDLAIWDRASDLRAVYLLAGRMQAFLTSQSRRFVVFLRGGTMVEALGTAFDVRVGAGGVGVAVLHGEVRLNHRLGVVAGDAGVLLAQSGEAAPRVAEGTAALREARAWWRATLAATGRSRAELLAESAVAAACYDAAAGTTGSAARVVEVATGGPVRVRLARYQVAAALFVLVAFVAVALVRRAPMPGEGGVEIAPRFLAGGASDAPGAVRIAEVGGEVAEEAEPDSSRWLKRIALDYEGWRADEAGAGPDFGTLASPVAATLAGAPNPTAQAMMAHPAEAPGGPGGAGAQRMPDEVYVKFLHASPRSR